MIKKQRITTEGMHSITLEQPGKYEIVLAKQGAQVEINGSFIAQGTKKIDVEIIIRHQAPHTQAQTNLRGVARDYGHIRFLGRIVIEPECGNSNSFLTERILLLSDESKAETIPELEILTDDVKCSHAASVSRIPEIQLWYLMSRGLPRREAEQLIIEGFLNV